MENKSLETSEEKNTANNMISVAVGLAVLFGTVWFISKAWKVGQK